MVISIDTQFFSHKMTTPSGPAYDFIKENHIPPYAIFTFTGEFSWTSRGANVLVTENAAVTHDPPVDPPGMKETDLVDLLKQGAPVAIWVEERFAMRVLQLDPLCEHFVLLDRNREVEKKIAVRDVVHVAVQS